MHLKYQEMVNILLTSSIAGGVGRVLACAIALIIAWQPDPLRPVHTLLFMSDLDLALTRINSDRYSLLVRDITKRRSKSKAFGNLNRTRRLDSNFLAS